MVKQAFKIKIAYRSEKKKEKEEKEKKENIRSVPDGSDNEFSKRLADFGSAYTW